MKTLFIGQSIIRLADVSSTNNYASALLKNATVMDGTVVIAHNQTNGKGQRGKEWLSEAGSNLIISIILLPTFIPAGRQFDLNKAMSVGIAGFVASCLPGKRRVSIKWPNDIYIDDKKIAGILIENNIRNNCLQSSVIGIGCNINQTAFNGKLINPTSLKAETGISYLLEDCLEKLCAHIEAKYIQLRSNNVHTINKIYDEALYKKDEPVWFEDSEGGRLKGFIRGTDDKGLLIIETETGLKSFNNTEISMLINPA